MPETAPDFTEQVAVIAGASRGIGRAIASEFARRGARLLLLARSGELRDVACELARVAEVLPVQCDVGEYETVEPAIASAFRRWGRLDVLVNTAAVLGATGEMWRSDPHDWQAALRANLLGTYHTMRAAMPHMIEARRGKVINFAGGGAAYGYPGFSPYASTKAAIVRLTETVALECAPYDVQVNVVAPGAIETDLLRRVRAAGGEVRTLGSMEQAVELVLYLASPQSNHLTGRFIHARDDYRQWNGLNQDSYRLRRAHA